MFLLCITLAFVYITLFIEIIEIIEIIETKAKVIQTKQKLKLYKQRERDKEEFSLSR